MNNSENLLSFLNRKILTIKSSQIVLVDVNLFDYFSDCCNKSYQSILSFYTFLINNILEKTEQTVNLDIYINEEIIEEPLRKFERVLYFFYSIASQTKFIENKKFYITFPQLNKTNIMINENEIFTININSIQNEPNSFNKNDYDYYLNTDEKLNQIYSIYKKPSDEFIISELNNTENSTKSTSEDLKLFSYDVIALGGSFDHMHLGHNILLTTAILLCKKTIKIGLTSDELVHKKSNGCFTQTYFLREENVIHLLENVRGLCQWYIGELNDGVGFAGTDPDINVLLVTKETLKGGEYVNDVRKKNNLDTLTIICANLIFEQTNEHKFLNDKKISSSFIRQKIINEISLEDMEELEKSWVKLCLVLLKISKKSAAYWFSKIRDLYMQSWRKYHTLNHIKWYIKLIEKLFEEGHIKDYINIMLSVWFHDVIYVPSRGDNEDRSCLEFKCFFDNIKQSLVLEETFDLVNPEKICNYIMSTKYHFNDTVYDDSDQNYLLDCDLYTFGAESFEYYLKVNKTIHFEYSHHLTESEWTNGRMKFLDLVMNKENIYRTTNFREKYETLARTNIKREYEMLNKPN